MDELIPYIIRGVLFGSVMGALYYFMAYRKREDRLKASIRGGVVTGILYGSAFYVLRSFTG